MKNKYYAFLRHRSQAVYRKEPYSLSWEDFQILWPDDKFVQRGRKNNSLCMVRRDRSKSWSLGNCEVITKAAHATRAKEFRKKQNV